MWVWILLSVLAIGVYAYTTYTTMKVAKTCSQCPHKKEIG
jgi:hypothetical protein